jgi:predicted lipoprotein with Yx(FWY)xxD motif
MSKRLRRVMVIVVALAGVLATAALAKTFALKVAKHATVTDTKGKTTHPTIVVNSHGFAVYTLTGDSPKHPECTKSNHCLDFWPPVTVKSAKQLSKASGVKGKLGLWHRRGFIQVTIDGHPLYTFFNDAKRDVATGEDLHTFGGFWHVRKASGGGHTTTGASTPTSGGW